MSKLIFIFLLIVCVGAARAFSAEEIPIVRIDSDIEPDKLPYMFGLSYTVTAATPQISNCPADIDGNGSDEIINFYNRDIGDGYWRSAILGYEGPGQGKALFQLNGCVKGAHIADLNAIDVFNGQGDDIVCIKNKFDSIFIEIATFDSNYAGTTYCFLADIAMGMQVTDSWHDLQVIPLGGIDLNNDGYRDLIYGQSGKLNRSFAPDSALERGVVAYDLENNKRLWFFPTADGAMPGGFRIVGRSDGSPIILIATPGFSNSYASNGMESRFSYLLAIDSHGKEIWRKKIGNAFFYPGIECLDYNNDGKSEIYYASDGEFEADGKTRIVVVDPETGIQIACSEVIDSGRCQISLKFVDPKTEEERLAICILASSPPRIIFIDKSLNIVTILEGSYGIREVIDLDLDGGLDYILALPNGQTAVLDHDFGLTAKGMLGSGMYHFYNSPKVRGIMVSDGITSWSYYELKKQSMVNLIFARYKWWLTVALASIIIGSLVLLINWIRRLYFSVQGLPTLDKINAMVMVLNRKGQIKFINSNPIVQSIMGPNNLKGKYYKNIITERHQLISDAIEKSFLEPLIPLQSKIEIEDNGIQKKIEILIYPRVDRHNNFLGKILIAETIKDKVDWERKVVLGEAAQRWVHKLKGSMATARITIENLEEDQRLGNIIRDNQIVTSYLNTIKGQIIETADIAGKILRFIRITKPQLIKTDLNQIVDRAASPYLTGKYQNITVAKMQQPGLPPISADPEQIIEVVDNLLSNAINSIKGEGIVTIKTKLASNLPLNDKNDFLELIVEDNGCGIEKDDFDKLFSPGFSLTANGTGIGLAIVKEILDNHNWQIGIESKPDEGSRFIISIPLEKKI
jgi:signal transduction histidine kinase